MGLALNEAGIWPGNRVLDPFAGTGRVHWLHDNFHFDTVGIEIEPEWAEMHPRTVVGDATVLPFATGSFHAICTSPTYGNRMADHHEARDASRRNTYTHAIGHKLHPNNSGAMQWGEAYRQMHLLAWAEAWRVLKPGGVFVLNISDHIRKGEVVRVSDWHLRTLARHGFERGNRVKVRTPRQRHGANGNLRVAHEIVATLRKAA